MAEIGDKAAAAGLPVEPPGSDVRQGYVAINRVSDALADHQTSGTHPFSRVTGQASTSQLADNAVTSGKIANSSITTIKLATSAVTDAKLAAGAVDTAKIQDRAVTVAKLAKRYAAGTVTVFAAPLGQPIMGVAVPHGLSGVPIVVVTPRNDDVAPYVTYSGSTVTAYARGNSGSVTLNWIAMEV